MKARRPVSKPKVSFVFSYRTMEKWTMLSLLLAAVTVNSVDSLKYDRSLDAAAKVDYINGQIY